MPLEKNHFYRFGSFRLDPAKCLLLRGQKAVPLMPKAFDTLLVLVENRDHTVGKEELMKSLWPDSFVEEANLAQNVAVLRKALGDSPEEHRFILTVPGRGYRFAAKVTEETEGEEADLVVERHSRSRVMLDESTFPKPGSAILVTPSTLLKRTRNRRLGVVAIAAVALIGATFVLNVVKMRDMLVGFLRSTSWSKISTAGPNHSIAVLPLENLSGDPQQDYFAEGMTDELTTDLAQLGGLRVISRTSAMQYKGAKKSAPQIGRELGVDVLIEGTVERVGDRVRIRTQLIDCVTDRHLWGSIYDGDLKDVLALESEAAREIAEQVHGNVASAQPGARSASVRPVDVEAFEAYLKGRYFWNKRTREGFMRAVEYFQAAIGKDPNYAQAYAGLADSYALISSYSLAPPNETVPKARAAALRALQIDDKLAEAHTSLALITENYDWDWQTAEREYQRATHLDPNYAVAHHWYAEYLALQGRFGQALAEMQLARQLDPLSLIMAIDNAAILYYARQYDRAIEQYRAVVAMEPGVGHAHIAVSAYAQKGQFVNALAEIDRWRRSQDGPWTWAFEAYVCGRAGQMARARYALAKFQETNRRWKTDPAGMLALAYIGIGDKDKALAWLEKAVDEHSSAVLGLKVDPTYDTLRSDPRFQDLLRRVGLADSATTGRGNAKP